MINYSNKIIVIYTLLFSQIEHKAELHQLYNTNYMVGSFIFELDDFMSTKILI